MDPRCRAETHTNLLEATLIGGRCVLALSIVHACVELAVFFVNAVGVQVMVVRFIIFIRLVDLLDVMIKQLVCSLFHSGILLRTRGRIRPPNTHVYMCTRSQLYM